MVFRKDPTGDVHPNNFFARGHLNWLKETKRICAYNFGGKGRNPTKLCRVICREAGMTT